MDSDTQNYIQAAELGNSYRLEEGDMLVALGSPLGYVPSVAWGIVSYIERGYQGTDGQFRLIQTDIAGDADAKGILLNTDGQIVGWITQNYAENTRTGILQAISVSDIKGLIESISNGREVAMLGVKVQAMNSNPPVDVTEETADGERETTAPGTETGSGEESGASGADAEEYETGSSAPPADASESPAGDRSASGESAESSGSAEASPEGLYVTDLVNGSPAYSAGIQNGDILTAIDGTPLTSVTDLENAMERLSPGDTVEVSVLRISRGRYIDQTFEVTLTAR